MFLPDVAGQLYGFGVYGPYDPERGLILRYWSIRTEGDRRAGELGGRDVWLIVGDPHEISRVIFGTTRGDAEGSRDR